MSTTFRRITGASLPETAFRVHESSGSLDVSIVFEVLRGNLAAYHLHDYVSPESCARIVENFWASDERVPRFGVGEDGVEAYLIGASHYGKPTTTYLQEVRGCKDAVESLYGGTINPVALFRDTIAREGGISVRAAEFAGLLAGDSKAIYWNNTGTFLLEPHEDLAQVQDPIQADFEIQQVSRVMAVNVYAAVAEDSGQLQLWNVEPDEETRAELGLSGVGFPYPADLLDDYSSMEIAVRAGDLCVINGNLVHAVMRGNTSLARSRLLLTCFTGLNFKNELIWWT
jgi:hypothetical protein